MLVKLKLGSGGPSEFTANLIKRGSEDSRKGKTVGAAGLDHCEIKRKTSRGLFVFPNPMISKKKK